MIEVTDEMLSRARVIWDEAARWNDACDRDVPHLLRRIITAALQGTPGGVASIFVLRDWFAGQALVAIADDCGMSDDEVAERCFERADAMMAKRVPTAASDRLGMWLSAALDDPGVCAEMKDDINAWFAAGLPSSLPTTAITPHMLNAGVASIRLPTLDVDDKKDIAVQVFRAMVAARTSSPTDNTQ